MVWRGPRGSIDGHPLEAEDLGPQTTGTEFPHNLGVQVDPRILSTRFQSQWSPGLRLMGP